MKTKVTKKGMRPRVELLSLKNSDLYLYRIANLLDRYNLKWCFAFGTALGLFRDNSFIPNDVDIDVMILADGIDITEVKEEMEEDFKLIRIVEGEGNYYQLAFQDEVGVIIDLCLFYKDEDNYISYCDGGYWCDKIDTVSPFIYPKTKYGIFPLPGKPSEYLKARYGDWETPKYEKRGVSIKNKCK